MKELDLGKEKINKLLLAFSIPCIISMLINSIYNIVDQIFIGKGVGTIGNAATNVIFPVVIICNALAQLIGNGCAANLSLRLGEGNKEEAKKSIGSSVTLLFISSFILAILGEIFLPVLVNIFGCTSSVYDSAITYGRIILIGAPFMIIYTALSSFIRADGSPKYSMTILVIGAVINLILDPIFIFPLKMGVAGGALATIIGQFVSFILAVLYLRKTKTIKLKLKDFALNKSVLKTMSLGVSSFVTQTTVLALFVVMNNLMTKYGVDTKYGADIPLSVYGIISKINNIYISSVLGIAIGAQPIMGFNYGARNYKRVKETIKKVLFIGLIIGFVFNIVILVFPKPIISIFITKTDPNYDLFMEFAVKFARIFLLVCAINALELCSGIIIQSLGNVKKATLTTFTRQIILFIPIAFILCHFKGLYGALYAGPIADILCFIFIFFLLRSEYKKLKEDKVEYEVTENINVDTNFKTDYVITINREYGSGGRYVGKILSEMLKVPCYDKEIISLSAEKSGLDNDFIKENEESRKSYYGTDNDIFIAESKVIKNIAKNPSIIIGRCSNYVLRNNKKIINVFLYSDMKNKEKRVTKYYNIPKENAKKQIEKINKQRAKYYKFYTGCKWNDIENYDIALNTDVLGVNKTAEVLKEFILSKNN